MSSPQTGSTGTETARERRSCFSVNVGDVNFGLPVSDTQTIFRIDNLTPVPLAPAHTAGLTNLRGRVLTVVSLRSKFDGSRANVATGALAIGLEVGGEDFALVVDSVGEVLDIDTGARIPVPPHFDGERARMTEGLYRVGDMLLSVLNVPELLDGGSHKTQGGAR